MSRTRTEVRRIQVGGRRLEYRLRRSRSAKRCRIRVQGSTVEVIVPRWAEEDRATAFLRANADWVLAQLADNQRQGPIRAATPAPQVLFRGVPLTVEIAEHPTRCRTSQVWLEGDRLQVLLPRGRRLDPWTILERWMREQARRDVVAQVARRSREMQVCCNRVFIRGQRTKWGNCSRLRNLSFNWRLVMAPPSVLDYLVVHELAHLREPSHSPRFWLIVQSYCPEQAVSRRWLASHQEQLLATRLEEP
jgi:predicted metal-dependent hydrolase